MNHEHHNPDGPDEAPDLPFDLAADADAAVSPGSAAAQPGGTGQADETDPALRPPPPPPPDTGIHPAIADPGDLPHGSPAIDAVVRARDQQHPEHPAEPFALIAATTATTAGESEPAGTDQPAGPDGSGNGNGNGEVPEAPFPPHAESGVIAFPDERPPIQMIDLTVSVNGRTLIRHANVGIGHGEVVLLVGGSGTGKSVLSKILLGLITRDTPGFVIEGKLLVHGRDILAGNTRECRRFGIVFQDYALFDEMEPRENLDFAFDHSQVRWLPHERERRLRRLSETLSLNLDTPISRSSGGERRRLAIARTLAYDPEIVLYDEPTTGLDPLNSERVAQLIGSSSRQFGKTCFVITHDYQYLRGVADRVLLLDPESRELVELDKEKATADFVRDKLQALAPPTTPPVGALRRTARRVGSFFVGTSRVLEASGLVPWRMLLWPFSIGLTAIGAVALTLLVLRGAASATEAPAWSAALAGAFALGAALLVAGRFRESRRSGMTAVMWLAMLAGIGWLAHGLIAPLFGKTIVSSPRLMRLLPIDQLVTAGSALTTMFLLTAVPAVWCISQVTRWRHAVVGFSLVGAVVMAGWCGVTGVSSLMDELDQRSKLEARLAAHEKGVTPLRAGQLETIRDELAAPWHVRLDVPAHNKEQRIPTGLPVGVWLLLAAVGFVVAGFMAPLRSARQHWGGRFYWHYLKLVASGTSIPYLACAGFITGFVATFFIYRYFPFRDYTEPLIIDDILHAVGFILFRVLIPLVASVLIAARCGAAVAADIGNRVYTHQSDALKTFRTNPEEYWGQNVMWAFIVGGPFLVALAFLCAAAASLIAFLVTHPDSTVSFWWLHFTWEIKSEIPGSSWPKDFMWLVAKVLVCSAGTAAIAARLGMRHKDSSVSVSRSITQTILWSTLFVLMVHLLFAFFEFRELKPPSRG